MSTFLEQLVSDDVPAAEVVQPEIQPATPEPASDGRARDEHGRFAPKAKSEGSETGVKQEAAPAPQTAQPQQAPEPPAGERGKQVPLEALTALKQKLAEREAELATLRKPAPEQQVQQPKPETPTTPTRPDFSFDPSYFEDDPQALFEARLHKTKMDMSTNLAVQQFGEDVLSEAWAAFDNAASTDLQASALSGQLRDHPHPMGEVVKWYQNHREIKQLTEAGGLQKLRDQLRAELLAEMQGTQPTAAAMPGAVPMPKPAATPLPPSLARGGAGSQSAPEIRSDNEMFESLFDKSKRQTRKR